VGGVAGGVCAARGPAWGLAALGVTAVADVAAERAIGGGASAYVFVGPAAYYFGTAAVNLVARRGFAATERALSAAEAATTAQLVADQRWRAARQVDRQLHDTVLATLTVLAHGGIGLSAEQIRAACERDVRLLTRTDVVDPRTPTVAVTGVAASLRLAVDRAVDDAVAAGLQVRVYGDIGHAVVHDVAAGALGAALHECLTNAHRHAAAGSVDVTTSVADGSAFVVVVDDGAGFDIDQIERDRLGLRVSVQERLREVGGDAIIWSRPGRGTSVLLRVPEVAG
jgi:signal transduction histidine kinase